jgi:peptidoglycan hydrolase-like protein with peptidoglycan-binding domain
MGIRDLERGMSGPDVKAIQEALDLQPGLKSPPLDHNGVFGPKTDAKVREFQALKHIKTTGTVGPLTRRALFPVGVATVTIIGTKQTSPTFQRPVTGRYQNVMPGRLTPPSIDLDAVKRDVQTAAAVPDAAVVKIPGAPQHYSRESCPIASWGSITTIWNWFPAAKSRSRVSISICVRIRTLSALPCSQFINAVRMMAPITL